MTGSATRRTVQICLLTLVFLLVLSGAALAGAVLELHVPATVVPGAKVEISGSTNAQAAGTPVGITVRNPSGMVVLVDETKADEKGNFSFTFTLPANANGNNWQVQAAGGGAAATKVFSVAGANDVVTASPTSVQPGKSITFSGKIKQGNVPVGITVKDPGGRIVFVDETTNGADGSFSFTFSVPATGTAGTWSADVSGGGTSGRTTFTVSNNANGGGSGGSGGGSSSGGGGGSSVQPTPGNSPAPDNGKGTAEQGQETRIQSSDGKMEVFLPAGAINAGTTVTITPINDARADNKMDLKKLASSFARRIVATYQITALDAQGEAVASSGKPFTITCRLSAGQTVIGGYYADPVYGMLVPVPTSYNPATGEVRLTARHFRTYTLVEEQSKNFRDVKSSAWYAGAVQKLARKNLIGGFPSGDFRPNENLTRGQAAKLITLGAQVPGNAMAVGLPDVKGHWAQVHINSAAAVGVIGGYPDGKFKPNQKVTRAELVSMILRALGEQATDSKAKFKDVGTKHWAAASIARAAQLGIAGGYPDGTFRPEAPVTRAEAASMIVKAFGLE